VRTREAAVVEDFAGFVRMALPGLLRYGHSLTGNPHDAADLVQGVLEKVGSRWNSVLGEGPEDRRDGGAEARTRRRARLPHLLHRELSGTWWGRR
jgi:hypothetical protein